MRGTYLRQALNEHPWALLEGHFCTLLEIVDRHVAGVDLSDEEIEARTGKARGEASPQAVVTDAGVAVLPLHGVVSHRMNLLSNISGGTSTEQFGAAFQSLVDDDTVKAIVLDVNSPGGSVYGLEGLHAQMLAARGRKPVIAAVNSLAASAALWTASAADQIAIAPGGDIGSIGVYMAHTDTTVQDANEGVKHTFISAGKYKTEGNPHAPLSDDAKAYLQGRVNESYDAFVNAVAAGRSVSADHVIGQYGNGRLLTAKQAQRVGLVDRVETFAQTLGRVSAGVPQRRSVSMQASDQMFRIKAAIALTELA